MILEMKRLLLKQCIHCGKSVGDSARYGKIRSLYHGVCDQCDEWGDSGPTPYPRRENEV